MTGDEAGMKIVILCYYKGMIPAERKKNTLKHAYGTLRCVPFYREAPYLSFIILVDIETSF